MALRAAVVCGLVGAVAVPYLARGHEDAMGGFLFTQLVRLPLGGGFELGWSWSVFAVVTLIAWALLAAARQN